MTKGRNRPAERESQREAQRQVLAARQQVASRRRLTRIVGGVVALLALIGSLLFALHGTGGSTTTTVVAAGLGAQSDIRPSPLVGQFSRMGPVLRRNGKPELLFLGALYCPHCAAERWAVVKALGQFGTFTGLRSTTNGDGVPTFDLTHATYTSHYVSFDRKDMQDQNHHNLDVLTPEENGLFGRLDPLGGIPLVSAGGYAMSGSPILPDEIGGKSFGAVRDGLQHGASGAYVRDINAETNVLTALLCHADGRQPSGVCGRAVIRSIVSGLHA